MTLRATTANENGGKGDNWGTPPNPRQGDPCTPYWGTKDNWGKPPNPGRVTPAPPIGGVRIIGGHPQTPGRVTPAPPFQRSRTYKGSPAGRISDKPLAQSLRNQAQDLAQPSSS